MYIKINGSQFHKSLAAFSFSAFKKEVEHSYAPGKTDAELKEVHDLIKQSVKQDGESSGVEKESTGSKR